MKALKTKLWRDLWGMKAQVLSVTLVVACGVSAYIAMVGTYRSLEGARDDYYRASGFADVFARVQRAPDRLLRDIERLEGVAAVEGRVSELFRVELPGERQPFRGHFTSAPRGAMNALFLRLGRAPGRGDEVAVSEVFAEAHGLRPGSTLWAIVNGRKTRLHVSGIGTTPEALWVMEPEMLSFGSERFGVFWMEHEALSSALGLQGAFNDVAVSLSPGGDEASVIDGLDRLLAPWGSYGAHGSDRVLSARLITQELGQLRGSATILPPIFLGVAAFLVNVLLSRLVHTQRQQLAALKALGYGRGQLGLHYLGLAMLTVAGGLLIGAALGSWVGGVFLELYADYFRFPVLKLETDPELILTATGISAASAAVGALAAVRRVLRLAPAEAMRSESPRSYRPTLLERMGLHRLVAVSGRMVLRELEQEPLRVLVSALGIAFATAILVGGYGGMDSTEAFMEQQFERLQREDVAVSFVRPLPREVVHALSRLPGVHRAEGRRTVPTRIRAGARSREVGLLAVSEGPTLRPIASTTGAKVELPISGLALSRTLADVLGVGVGDALEVELLEGARPRRTMVVSALVDDLLGLSAYLREPALARELGEAPLVTEVLLSVDRGRLDELLLSIERLPSVGSFALPETARDTFRRQMAEMLTTFQLVLAGFALAIAVGVVFNNARIAYVTRARELATLRILGFRSGEVGAVLVWQQLVQLALGIPLGLLLGRGLVALAFTSMDKELFRMGTHVSSRTLATAALIVLAAGLVSAGWVARRVRRMDLVAVLKAED